MHGNGKILKSLGTGDRALKQLMGIAGQCGFLSPRWPGNFRLLDVENEIKVFQGEWLDRLSGVEMKDGRILSLTCLSKSI